MKTQLLIATKIRSNPRHRLPHRRLVSTQSDEPLLIVGGGPCGLLMSNLLSLYNVPSILLERQTPEARFRHPQAHFLNTRTMEILRYWLPHVYTRVQQEMPPVQYWKSFRFVRDMSSTTSSSSPPLATVIHPVDRPLQAERDANGVLLEDTSNDNHFLKQHDDDAFHHQQTKAADLSPCCVGHLAQHTFCRILYDAAQEQAAQSGIAELRYGTSVTAVEPQQYNDDLTMSGQQQQQQSHPNVIVYADDNTIGAAAAGGSKTCWITPLCIAADGAHSMLRQQAAIPQVGQEGLQHLINIHVTLPAEQACKLHENDNNYAMLYSIFSEQVVAMVVCHSIGEYVIQIPYFPPYQSLQDDFGQERVDSILQAIFGDKVDRWNVHSVNTWTMSSLVADRYFKDGIVLVGDAAHVFPPAGGFGMNTGLQDVHNLAWKLAWAYHSGINNMQESLCAVLKSYQAERQRIAQENAALSVRNYKRLLQVTKACYLNEQHPRLLAHMLGQSPLPLTAKQTIFRSALQAALFPLSWLDGLETSSVYARHIRSNLRRILKTGVGLPLLFPRYELGFGYGRHERGGGDDDDDDDVSHIADKDGDWMNDTWASRPSLEKGKLLPHVEAKVVSDNKSRYPKLQYLTASTTIISTSNLPAQVARDARPAFVLLTVGDADDTTWMEKACREISNEIKFPVELVWIRRGDQKDNQAVHEQSLDGLVLQEPKENNAAFSFFSPSVFPLPYALLIRPDGHVASIVSYLDETCRTRLLVDAMSSLGFTEEEQERRRP